MIYLLFKIAVLCIIYHSTDVFASFLFLESLYHIFAFLESLSFVFILTKQFECAILKSEYLEAISKVLKNS